MLSVLTRDEEHLLGVLHKYKVVSERGEEERAMVRNWACDFVTAEMAARGGQESLRDALCLMILEGWRGDLGAH